MEKRKTRLEPEIKLAELTDLRTLNTGIIIEKLENDMKLREMGLLQRLKLNHELLRFIYKK